MKTIYFAATSLDGYIADKNNSLEWLFQFGEPEGNVIENFVNSVGVLAMGSTTYMWLYDHLSKSKESWPYKVPSFVFTSKENLPLIDNADIRIVRGDVVPVHQKMSEIANGKTIWIMGGGELAGKFYDANLLDEMQLHVASTTIGGGAPLFPRLTNPPLILESVQQRGTGGVELTYKVPKH
ncbi:dihydrofolate reductase family protein [Peredibacter starrii]|uniref:Dihydrofolate reductase family protein n=1 Tax=Peredibacter starrii TaxID=28202 RepID=A0AAX4HN66_9BACT|nr:dihydrofolate reductase family protein [Peredibacter starrii]WPU64344.1 dihydrofolate reductase family protein [Peredibacter starrii]